MRKNSLVGCASAGLFAAISASAGAQSEPSSVPPWAIVVHQEAMKVRDPSSSASVPPGIFPPILGQTFGSPELGPVHQTPPSRRTNHDAQRDHIQSRVCFLGLLSNLAVVLRARSSRSRGRNRAVLKQTRGRNRAVLKQTVVGFGVALSVALALLLERPTFAELTDKTQTTSINAGINKSFGDEANDALPGDGRGDAFTPGSSLFIIARDPFRAVRRGRQVFQRKFTRDQGQGPRVNSDSTGDLNDVAQAGLGAGLSDSCAGCHARPRGSAGLGGDVATRPDSRSTPHLFGVGLREMLADEITGDLREIRDNALSQAQAAGTPVTLALSSKGISFGSISALPNGTLNTSSVQGVDPDLRVMQATTMAQHLAMSRLPAQMGAFILSAFAVLALALASLGVYGLVRYTVARRTREVGIRMALGADAAGVTRLLATNGVRLVLIGGAIGVAASLLAARFLATLLYGVGRFDPVALIGASLVLVVSAWLAAYLPARRASRSDPLAALRYE